MTRFVFFPFLFLRLIHVCVYICTCICADLEIRRSLVAYLVSTDAFTTQVKIENRRFEDANLDSKVIGQLEGRLE